MASATVRVSGLRETVRALNKMSRTVSREVQNELKTAAEPVRAAAEQKISRYSGVGPVRTRSRVGSVYVEQSARKVTGARPDFGALQMRTGFVPALEENEAQVRSSLEDALDRITSTF